MVFLFLSLSVLAFLACLRFTGLVEKVILVGRLSGEAATVMRNDALDDDQKEELVQQAATRLLGTFCLIVVYTAICILVPLGIVYAGIFGGLFSEAVALEGATNWIFLVLSTIAANFIYRAIK